MSKVNQLGNYKGIEVTISSRQVNQEDVEREIQQLLSQRSQLVEKDGTVENGDVTPIDFKGLKDGVAFDGGTAEGFRKRYRGDSTVRYSCGIGIGNKFHIGGNGIGRIE